MAGMTTRELLEKLYNQDYEKLKGKKLRMTRVREMCIRDSRETQELCWDKESTAESCALLSKLE